MYAGWRLYRGLCVAHDSGCVVGSGLQNLLACHRAYATAIATALGGGGGMALVDQQVKLQTAGGGAGSSAGGAGAAGAGAGELRPLRSGRSCNLQPPRPGYYLSHGGLHWLCGDPYGNLPLLRPCCAGAPSSAFPGSSSSGMWEALV